MGGRLESRKGTGIKDKAAALAWGLPEGSAGLRGAQKGPWGQLRAAG